MKCEATVYHFRFPDESGEAGQPLPGCGPARFGGLTIHLDIVGKIEVDGAGQSSAAVAARAWIEAVGRHRQMFLIEELDAPVWIAEEQVMLQSIVADMSPAPTGFPGLFGFIFDNGVECWFITIESEWMPDQSRPASTVWRPQWFQAGTRAPEAAFGAPWSLNDPSRN